MLYSPEAAPCRSHPKPMGWPEGSQLWQAGPSSAWLWFHRDAAVGNTYTIPSLPEQRVLATVLKADKADPRTIVGKGVGDLWGERNKTVVGKCQTTTNLLSSAQGLQPHPPQPYLPAWVMVGKEILGALCPSTVQRPLNFSQMGISSKILHTYSDGSESFQVLSKIPLQYNSSPQTEPWLHRTYDRAFSSPG